MLGLALSQSYSPRGSGTGPTLSLSSGPTAAHESKTVRALAICLYMDYIALLDIQVNDVRATRKVASRAIEPGFPRLDASRFSTANRRRLSAPGLRTFLTIADLWSLSEEQRRLILGYPSRSTFHNWAKSVREHQDITLDVDVLTRISTVLGIHQGLGILHEDERDAVAWLRRPNLAPVFGGRPPLDLIANGTIEGLLLVRRFLDGARGGIFMAPNAIDEGFRGYSDADIVFS